MALSLSLSLSLLFFSTLLAKGGSNFDIWHSLFLSFSLLKVMFMPRVFVSMMIPWFLLFHFQSRFTLVPAVSLLRGISLCLHCDASFSYLSCSRVRFKSKLLRLGASLQRQTDAAMTVASDAARSHNAGDD